MRFRHRTCSDLYDNEAVQTPDSQASYSQVAPEDEIQSEKGEGDEFRPEDFFPPGWTGTGQLETFNEDDWRAIVQQFPFFRWDGDDSWYLAVKKNKNTKRTWQEWERVPRLGPQDPPRYRAYKQRERKDMGPTGEQIWSPLVERAFEIACLCIPPILGKKKVPLRLRNGETKLFGRNELISWKIYQLNGMYRARKQISSHIQVVKKLLRADGDQFLYFVETRIALVEAVDSKAIGFDQFNGTLVVRDPSQISCPAKSKNKALSTSQMAQYAPAATATTFSNIAPTVFVQSVSFDMLLHGPEKEILHTCTTMQSDVGAPQRLFDATLAEYFPDLEKCLLDAPNEHCDLILFESSVQLIEQSPQNGSTIAISFSVDFASAVQYSEWRFRTTRYESNGQYVMHKVHVPDQGPKLKIQKLAKNRYRLLEAPLTSEWWVEIFLKAIDRRNKAIEEGHAVLSKLGHGSCTCEECTSIETENARALQAEEDEIRRELSQMSFMQEVFTRDGASRIAIFLWRFQQAQPGQAPTTTWQRLTRTPNSNTPHALLDSAMVLGSSDPSNEIWIEQSQKSEITQHHIPAAGWEANWFPHTTEPSFSQERFEGDEHDFTLPSNGYPGDHTASVPWHSAERASQILQSYGHSYNDNGLSTASSLEIHRILGHQSSVPAVQPLLGSQDQEFYDDIAGLRRENSQQHEGNSQIDHNSSRTVDSEMVPNLQLPPGLDEGQQSLEYLPPHNDLSQSWVHCDREPAVSEQLEEHNEEALSTELSSSFLHAPQPIRPVHSIHFTSPVLHDADQDSRHSSISHGHNTVSTDLTAPTPLHAEELCADGAVLAQLAKNHHTLHAAQSQDTHSEDLLPNGHDPYYTSHVPSQYILRSNDCSITHLNTNEHDEYWQRNIEPQLHSNVAYRLQSSLLVSAHHHPHAEEELASPATNTSHVEPDSNDDAHNTLESIQMEGFTDQEHQQLGLEAPANLTTATGDIPETPPTSEIPSQQPAEAAMTHVPSFEDTSWVCDIAIAHLEGWIEHANAMEAEIANATAEAGGSGSTLDPQEGSEGVLAVVEAAEADFCRIASGQGLERDTDATETETEGDDAEGQDQVLVDRVVELEDDVDDETEDEGQNVGGDTLGKDGHNVDGGEQLAAERDVEGEDGYVFLPRAEEGGEV